MSETRTIAVRLAVLADRAEMEAISERTWGGNDYLGDVLDNWFAEPESYFYVAEAEDGTGKSSHILGFARLVRLGADEWWMEGLRVDPEHYRQGVGRLLEQHCVRQAETLGRGLLRLATSGLNEAVHKLVAEAAFVRLGSYTVYRTDALPQLRHADEFRALTPDDLPAVRAFLTRSAYYEQAVRSLEYSYKWYLITDERLGAWMVDRLVYGWTIAGAKTLDGVLILNPLPTSPPGRVPILSIGYVDARVGQLASMVQAVRALAATLGYRKIQLRFLALPERLVALEQAGWRAVRHQDPVWLFGRSINLEPPHAD